ncbi:MAG: cell envelope integrity EipB family protein [Hyphomicrobium sp.]|nr:cell envelope integrity EipB family protein [Hyphomicrobium sp.]
MTRKTTFPSPSFERRHWALLLIPLASAPASAAAPPTSAAPLRPHRAIYDLKLENAAPGGGISDIRGRIVYELTGNACEGYAQSMRYVTETTNSEGASETTDLRTSSWEAAPAGRFRFAFSTYLNDQMADRTQGVATKDPGSRGPVEVEIVKPQKKAATVKSPVYFPIEHSQGILSAAKAGERLFIGDLYDGSEGGEKVYATTSVIGRSVPEGAKRFNAKFKNADLLAGVKSWPVSISYFNVGQTNIDATPLYEMSFRFHENGVTGDLKIDHGSHSLRGDIAELTYLPENPCPATATPR